MVNINKKLPHKYPVKFIKEVIEEAENYAISLVEFKEKPTLAAAAEASAQNVVFIQSLSRYFNGGVLVEIKNVEFLANMEIGAYQTKSILISKFDHFCIIEFTLSWNNSLYARGELSIAMKEKV